MAEYYYMTARVYIKISGAVARVQDYIHELADAVRDLRNMFGSIWDPIEHIVLPMLAPRYLGLKSHFHIYEWCGRFYYAGAWDGVELAHAYVKNALVDSYLFNGMIMCNNRCYARKCRDADFVAASNGTFWHSKVYTNTVLVYVTGAE